MQNITIGRYKPGPTDFDLGPLGSFQLNVSSVLDGWIEGVRDDGSKWIMFLDATGNPMAFWAQRDECGGVIGKPIDLGSVIDLDTGEVKPPQ